MSESYDGVLDLDVKLEENIPKIENCLYLRKFNDEYKCILCDEYYYLDDE